MDNTTGWRFSGLVNSNLQPLPAYNAFRFSAAQLQGTAYVDVINQFPGVKGYEFTRQGKRLSILWSLDGKDHLVQLPNTPSAIYDVFGAPQQAIQSAIITLAPVYVELGP